MGLGKIWYMEVASNLKVTHGDILDTFPTQQNIYKFIGIIDSRHWRERVSICGEKQSIYQVHYLALYSSLSIRYQINFHHCDTPPASGSVTIFTQYHTTLHLVSSLNIFTWQFDSIKPMTALNHLGGIHKFHSKFKKKTVAK